EVYETKCVPESIGFRKESKTNKKDKEAQKKALKEQETDDVTSNSEGSLLEGRRFADLKLLAQQMWCTSCKCHNCLLINEVNTSKQHVSVHKRSGWFDTNSKAALTSAHSKGTSEIGPVIEEDARESCANPATRERELTIENAAKLNKHLPESLQEGFIIPKKPTAVSSPLIDGCIPEDASNNSEESAVSFADVVPVMGSYDMG
ncbi:hypothetical protein PV326_012043, partial [Microctonus aethiopoides]